ncbi:MAG: flippase [Clostridia bacterium]|nr:flippase [Clostridia bacterium]
MNIKTIKNAGWIIASKVAQSVINLVISMISARYLGPSNYGLINYAASIVAFVVPIMQLGLSKTLVLEIIERPDKEGEVVGTAVFMNCISALACMAAVFGYLRIVDADEPETILVGILYSVSLLFQATDVLHYWFQAKLLSKYTSIASFFAYCIVACYKIFLLVSGKSVYWFAVTSSVDFIFVTAILLIFYKKLGAQKLSVSLPLGRELFRRSKHYIVSAMMVTIYQQTDRIMLKQILDETETGYYSAAVACIGITGFVFAAIVDSFRPGILEAKKKGDTEGFHSEMKLLYSIITYLALAQCIFMTLLARPIILVLYGEKYLNSVLPLRIAVWYSTFSYYGSVRNIWILAEGKQKYLWMINLSGALTNIILNALLIPRIGAVGAAAASLATQFFTNVIIGFVIKPIRYNNTLMIEGLNPKPLAILIRNGFAKIKKEKL